MTVTEILLPAIKLIMAGWSQGAEARDKDGRPVHPSRGEAVSFSATGAIYRVVGFDGQPESRRRYEAAVKAVTSLQPRWLSWHDSPDRRVGEVASALLEASFRSGEGNE